MGLVVLVRDTRGRKMYGTYFVTDVNYTAPGSPLRDVKLAVSQVTFSEAV